MTGFVGDQEFMDRLRLPWADQNRLLRVDEVALWLQLSPKTVRRMVSEAQFRTVKIRGCLRINAVSVAAYLARKYELSEQENGSPE